MRKQNKKVGVAAIAIVATLLLPVLTLAGHLVCVAILSLVPASQSCWSLPLTHLLWLTPVHWSCKVMPVPSFVCTQSCPGAVASWCFLASCLHCTCSCHSLCLLPLMCACLCWSLLPAHPHLDFVCAHSCSSRPVWAILCLYQIQNEYIHYN